MKFKPVLVAAMALAASTAWSADNGFYVGAGIGMSDVSANVPMYRDFSGNDFAYKLFVGYDFMKYLAVEGGYVDGGTPSDRGVDVGIDGWDLQVIGKWPVTEAFDLHARLGWAWYQGDVKGYGFHDSADDNDLLYGLGVGYTFGEHLWLTGDWEALNISDGDVNLFTVGLAYKF